MQTATLNQYQKHVVNLMVNVDETQQMEISTLLANENTLPRIKSNV